MSNFWGAYQYVVLFGDFSEIFNMRPLHGLPKDKFHLSFGGALQNAAFARH